MGTKSYINITVDRRAPRYRKVHFPAGDDSSDPGAGAASQKQAASSNTWTPFEPLSVDNDWRYGVCGDLKTNPKRLKGGRYYYGGKVVREYVSGGLLEMDISIVVHHNGYMSGVVCDLSKCADDDISESCLQTPGACVQLKRAPNPICDSGDSMDCAPIDPNYPERWYIPCTRQVDPEKDVDFYGRDGAGNPTILYEIPRELECEHCVLQWYWVSGDRCNPPGTKAFFTNPATRPNWGNCPGAGGARNGWVFKKSDCGRQRFPEEYVNCADISIRRAEGQNPAISNRPTTTPTAAPTTTSTPTPTPSAVAVQLPSGDVAVRAVRILANGVPDTDLEKRYFFDIVGDTPVTIQADVSSSVDSVRFVIDGVDVATVNAPPFYIGGTVDSPSWNYAPEHVNRLLEMKTIASNSRTGESVDASHTFILIKH